ncbi:hypothetical protein [Paraburkholderia sp. BR10954]|uniref:hypothetical protein n=1 Tax=Paraburkholderia sp. BR10954 TaxID=3236995 RepID=UPI0034D21720
MQKSGPPATPPQSPESGIGLVEENAVLLNALEALLEKSAEFAQHQTHILARITQMAQTLTRKEGLAKDRAMLAALLKLYAEDRTAAVKDYASEVTAARELHRSIRYREDHGLNPWPLKISISIH